MKLYSQISFLFFSIFLFNSCSKNESNTIINENTLSSKWETNALTGIQSIELNKSNSYIVVEKNQNSSDEIYYGTYEVVSASEVSLSNYGTLLDIELLEEKLNFTLQKITGESETYHSQKAPEVISASVESDLLSQTWKLIKIDDELVEGTTEEVHVIFSQSGTYFVSKIYYESHFVSQWMWQDDQEMVLCYSHDGEPICEENENEVIILELTEDKLVVDEYGEIFDLEPL